MLSVRNQPCSASQNKHLRLLEALALLLVSQKTGDVAATRPGAATRPKSHDNTSSQEYPPSINDQRFLGTLQVLISECVPKDEFRTKLEAAVAEHTRVKYGSRLSAVQEAIIRRTGTVPLELSDHATAYFNSKMATLVQHRSAKEVVERLLKLINDSDCKTYTAHISQAALGLVRGPTMSAYLQDAFRPLKLLANYYMAIEEIVSITFGPYREQIRSLNVQPVCTSNSDVGRYLISLVTNIGSRIG